MTDEQRSVYNEIMDVVLNNRGGVFFVYGYGGTGKTFIWHSLCSGIRSKGEIVVAVASSGIAATFIPGGVTAHSRLSIPLNVLKLTKNMCLQGGRTSDNVDDIRKLSEWILEIGDGLADGENDRELWNPDYLQERAILAPTHEIVEAVNDYVLSKIDEDEVIYLSFDEVSNDDIGMGDSDLHSTEYLNSIKFSGLPNHQLKLKVGDMVMLLRNIDQSRGLCNGTRLIMTDLA
ncbi:uncharacterized protein LOC141600773 [Silene latifolia]|uniref:uncharacterized protein LOC141600773 n=1 Tax=Silene latifolia TaxID=37657 RepID=UPI003D76DFC0